MYKNSSKNQHQCFGGREAQTDSIVHPRKISSDRENTGRYLRTFENMRTYAYHISSILYEYKTKVNYNCCFGTGISKQINGREQNPEKVLGMSM